MLHGVAAVFEADEVLAAVAIDLDFKPRGKRVDDGSADAMEAAGDLITRFAAELAARVKDRENRLDAGKAAFGNDVDGDAAAIVLDGNRVSFVNRHDDVVAIAGEGFVDRIVDDLPHEVVEARRGGGGDIHARAFADRLKSLKDLKVARAVIRFRFFEFFLVGDVFLRVLEAVFLVELVAGR